MIALFARSCPSPDCAGRLTWLKHYGVICFHHMYNLTDEERKDIARDSMETGKPQRRRTDKAWYRIMLREDGKVIMNLKLLLSNQEVNQMVQEQLDHRGGIEIAPLESAS